MSACEYPIRRHVSARFMGFGIRIIMERIRHVSPHACLIQTEDLEETSGTKSCAQIGLDAAKVSIGLLLTAPYMPMLFMGEEWATSSPFADHDDEEMRRQVAEGRKNEFAAFGFGKNVPDPEDGKTYEMSKLNWDEQTQDKHAEMLLWVKSLIKLRRSKVCLNDGDMHRLEVSFDEEKCTLVMARDEARIFINLGKDPYTFALLEGEELELVSRDEINVRDGFLDLPRMTLAILMSTTEAVENRSVESHMRDKT